jgi:hypothetical protein
MIHHLPGAPFITAKQTPERAKIDFVIAGSVFIQTLVVSLTLSES